MMKIDFLKKLAACAVSAILFQAGLSAQPASGPSKVIGVLKDAVTSEPVGFATLTLTHPGDKDNARFTLSNTDGGFAFEKVGPGKYVLKAELLGYHTYSDSLVVRRDSLLDLGTLKVSPDYQQLDAAKVSAVGNAIVVKKDTIEYNASSFKTTENDVLEDLIKKLPGAEVSEDGSITFNGQTLEKITINGKTFFLDDPQLASKNLPAKMIDKLKVINKKSEQAEFTGIDDGEETLVLDLQVRKSMMRGMFGNASLGGGADIPSTEVDPQARYQGAAFLEDFRDDVQVSILLNGNNTNNRGFNDLSGSMMQGMRGGGGMGRGQGGWGSGNGITTSYMAGGNAVVTILDDKMELGGNYLYNNTSTDVEESGKKTTFLDGYNLLNSSNGLSNSSSDGHRFGVRMDYKLSDDTWLLFEPRINFGKGSFFNHNNDTTWRITPSDTLRINDAYTDNNGVNDNVSTSGFFLLRQRLGMPGRTLTARVHYNISNNSLDGFNRNGTNMFAEDGSPLTPETVDQYYESKSNSYGVTAGATYTEPLGGNLYAEVNYEYNLNRSESGKNTFNRDAENGEYLVKDYTYSNEIVNRNIRQRMGANLMYQNDDFRAQVGFSAMPTSTFNSTTRFDATTGTYTPRKYSDDRWNFAPSAMMWGEFNESTNARLFYRGQSSQPSTNQLMPVPDNSNPLNVNFGNPNLTPYFSHSFNSDFRYNNKQTFTSMNVRLDGSFVTDPIVNVVWYNNGAQYAMPVNGPSTANLGGNIFFNIPIGKSNFSISDMTRVNWSRSASYVGTDISMDLYDTDGFYAFMEDFVGKFNNLSYREDHITLNTTETVGITERLRMTYRTDNLELQASGRTRMNRSWYTIATVNDNTTTWNNQVRGSVVWTTENGFSLKSDFNYNWYDGYITDQKSEYILNAEISKAVLDKSVTLTLKGYDILGQAKNLNVVDASNYHQETVNNTLGRYIIFSVTCRFGKMGGMKGSAMGPGHGMGGPRR